jgi:hypothetical protein
LHVFVDVAVQTAVQHEEHTAHDNHKKRVF